MLVGKGLCQSARNTFLTSCLVFLPQFYCLTGYFCHDVSPVETAQRCFWTAPHAVTGVVTSPFLHMNIIKKHRKIRKMFLSPPLSISIFIIDMGNAKKKAYLLTVSYQCNRKTAHIVIPMYWIYYIGPCAKLSHSLICEFFWKKFQTHLRKRTWGVSVKSTGSKLSAACQGVIHPVFSKGQNIYCLCSSYCMSSAISRF